MQTVLNKLSQQSKAAGNQSHQTGGNSLPPIVNVGQGAIANTEKTSMKSSQTNPSKKKRKTSVLYGHGSSRRVGQMTEQVMKAYGVPKGYVQGSLEGKPSDRKHMVRR